MKIVYRPHGKAEEDYSPAEAGLFVAEKDIENGGLYVFKNYIREKRSLASGLWRKFAQRPEFNQPIASLFIDGEEISEVFGVAKSPIVTPVVDIFVEEVAE